MADENMFQLKIICPDRIFYEGEASMLELNTTAGQIGVYARHVPMTMIIAPGVVTITEAEEKKEAAIHSGFLEILPDKITIMAEVAEWAHEIDLKRAEEAKQRAKERLESKDESVNIARAEAALARSIARISLTNR